jgi:hypothetical protein
MTRGEIKRRIRLLGRHYFGSDSDQDPFGLDLLIIEVANQIARSTDCYNGRRYLDLVADTTEYCAPDLYRIRNVQVKNTGGDWERMRLFDAYNRKVDMARNDGSSAYPTMAVFTGPNKIAVYPPPASAIPQGIMIEGYAIPGDYWQYDVNGVALPMNDDAECPLPDVAHDCLVYGVLAQRAMQSKDGDGFQMYQAQYVDRIGMVESYAATYFRRAV